MARRNSAVKRQVLEDPVYNSIIITKLINGIMQDGKKSLSQSILYSAFDIIKKKTNKEPMEIFEIAIKNITPELEIKTRRIGGANYQVPTEVSLTRKQTLALRWLINFSRARSEHTMESRLALEIIDASNKTGATFKKKEDTHKMAEANKAFAHFRW